MAIDTSAKIQEIIKLAQDLEQQLQRVTELSVPNSANYLLDMGLILLPVWLLGYYLLKQIPSGLSAFIPFFLQALAALTLIIGATQWPIFLQMKNLFLLIAIFLTTTGLTISLILILRLWQGFKAPVSRND